MLMDMLYDTLPARTPKRRVHFHAFMLDMHKSVPLYPTPFEPAELIVDKHILRKRQIRKPILYQY
jgi:predicted ATPase